MRTSRDTVLMGTAQLFAQRATCSRAQVGAVLSREGRILVTGYNGAPAGMRHCSHWCDCETTPPGHSPDCDSITPCLVSVHAEANAIAYAARYGISTQGTDLHTTVSPCLSCSQILINAGIQRVVYAAEYRNKAGITLLRQAGVYVEAFSG